MTPKKPIAGRWVANRVRHPFSIRGQHGDFIPMESEVRIIDQRGVWISFDSPQNWIGDQAPVFFKGYGDNILTALEDICKTLRGAGFRAIEVEKKKKKRGFFNGR